MHRTCILGFMGGQNQVKAKKDNQVQILKKSVGTQNGVKVTKGNSFSASFQKNTFLSYRKSILDIETPIKVQVIKCRGIF